MFLLHLTLVGALMVAIMALVTALQIFLLVLERFSKVISRLHWFCVTALCDSLTKLAPLSQPMGIQTKTNRVFVARVFPRLAPVACIFFRILIGSLCCLHLLVRVITLVLVLRHSIENQAGSILLDIKTCFIFGDHSPCSRNLDV